MRFSTPISSIPISSKGQVGIRGAVAIGVYSDLYIKRAWKKTDGTVDYLSVLNELKRQFKYGSAVGYTDFRPFMEGYYDYQEALFKMVIKCSATEQTPEISRLSVVIDVPDVVEADTCVISAEQAATTFPNTDTSDTSRAMTGEIFVTFKKNFYSIPTITARQLTGSDVGTPKIRQGAYDVINTIINSGVAGASVAASVVAAGGTAAEAITAGSAGLTTAQITTLTNTVNNAFETAGNKGFWISLKSGDASMPGSIHWQAIGY